MTYVGAGMICSHLVSLSLLFGVVLSWGVMWPLISKLKGEWFPDNIPEESVQSLNGYKVFISIALIFGDGFYNFFKVLLIVLINVYGKMKRKATLNAGFMCGEGLWSLPASLLALAKLSTPICTKLWFY
ncbi:unnamed protein product [Amaranthus hypochondriacus]